MPLVPERFKALRDAKGFSQEDLAAISKVSHSTIAKIEKGTAPTTGSDILERLAVALDSTTDFFFGRGFEGVDASVAAANMSFEVFARDPKFSIQQREWCRRVLVHADAPKTARGWCSLAEMLNLAIGPTPSASSRESGLTLMPKKIGPKSKR